MKPTKEEILKQIGHLCKNVIIVDSKIYYTEKATLEAMDEYADDWISVKDRLPEKGVEVLAVNKYKKYLCGYIVCGSGFYDCESDDQKVYNITHWMPLPEPPKV